MRSSTLRVAVCFSTALLLSTGVVAAQEKAPEPAPPAAPKPAPPVKEATEADKPAEPEKPAEAEKPADAEKPAEEAGAPQAEREAPEEAAVEAPDSEAVPAEPAAAGADQATDQKKPEADGAKPAPEAAEEPQPTGNEGRKSASSNQATEPPQDDYEGASDQALVEKPEREKNLSLGIALDLTWPLGSAANFIDNASLQGLSLDLRYYAWGNIGIGVGVALDSLSKKLDGTVLWNNATITGTQVREISYTPITAKGYYSWRESERFIPYVAAGLGAARSVRRLVVGFSSLAEDSWHFAMVPEAGLQIPAGPTMILTNVRLNYLPASGGVEEQVFANFSFGLSIQ